MNTCIDAETLSAYCDGVLDAPEQARVESHLQQCWHCRRVESDYRSLGCKIAHLPDMDVPEGFRRNIITRLEAERRSAAPSPSGRGLLNHSWVRAAAAVVLVTALAVPGYSFYLNHRGNMSPAEVSQVQSGAMQNAAAPDKPVSAGSMGGGYAPNMAAQPQADAAASPQAALRGSGTKSADTVNVKTASVELHVKNVQAAGQMVLKQAAESQGVEVSFFEDSEGRGRITLQVPGTGTQGFLAGLDKIGKVVTVTSWGNIADPSSVTSLNINIISP